MYIIGSLMDVDLQSAVRMNSHEGVESNVGRKRALPVIPEISGTSALLIRIDIIYIVST